jgi:NitT/TauT family transport system substrate-binding protein
MIKKLLIFVVIFGLIFSVGCAKTSNDEKKKIIIADQFGLAYAPIQIMKEKGYLQEELKDYEIVWVKLGNAAAIREAMIADKLDIGFMGIPPFIIGFDKGTDWKIFSGLSSSPLGLVSNSERIKSLKDIRENDRIVLPQPGSIQHILLKMAADKTFNDSSIYDKQLLTMNHSDGMNILLSDKDVNLHFTSPPYLFEELQNDKIHLVIDSEEAFGGEFTFIVGVCDESVFNEKKEYNAFLKALDKSIVFVNNSHDETIDILSKYYDYDKEVLTNYIYENGIVYNSSVKGLDRFANFMNKEKMIDEKYLENELIWENVR